MDKPTSPDPDRADIDAIQLENRPVPGPPHGGPPPGPRPAWHVTELAFTSNRSGIGPLIARFRDLWAGVATKWAIRHLLRQQNAFNRVVAGQLSAQDREQTALTRDVAELTLQVIQLRKEVRRQADEITRLRHDIARSGSEPS